MPTLPLEDAPQPLIPPALERPASTLVYTIIAIGVFFIALWFGITIQQRMLISMNYVPAQSSRNPITMVAIFIVQWKAIKRISAGIARQRAEAEQGTELLQLRRGGRDRNGESEG